MPSSSEIADWTSNYFAKNQKHTADVLSGPKREGWFSSETFVALSQAARPLKNNEILPDFSCWGEQEFSTVLGKVEAKAGVAGDSAKRPDIVCYLPTNGDEAIDAILEVKLLLNAENSESTSTLNVLKGQLLNARQLAAKAKVLGLVFLAAAPVISPGTFEGDLASARSKVECVLSEKEGFSWVAGHDFSCVFRSVNTGFHYPSMAVSLALAVRELLA